MIINNLIIGKDKYNRELKCGDICSFKIDLERKKGIVKTEELKGMIIYDEDSYAFAFETLDDFCPILLMSCAEYKSVEKLYEANNEILDIIEDGESWKIIYNNNSSKL